MNLVADLQGILAPAITGILGVLGALFLRRSSKESNSTTQWKALFEGHQQWTRDQLSEQDEWTKARLAERDQKIANLERDVHELSDRFSALDEKYRAALSYIRQLWRVFAAEFKHEEIPIAPENISPDL